MEGINPYGSRRTEGARGGGGLEGIDPYGSRRTEGAGGGGGQRAPEVAAAREEWSARVRERERRARGVGCVGGSASCGLGDVGETGGPLDQEHPTVIRHDPREMLLDQSECSISVLHFLTI